MKPSGIEPATFRFVAQHLNHCAAAVPQDICIFSKTVRLAPGPIQLSVEWVPGVLFPSVRRPWREVNLAEAAIRVKNGFVTVLSRRVCMEKAETS